MASGLLFITLRCLCFVYFTKLEALEYWVGDFVVKLEPGNRERAMGEPQALRRRQMSQSGPTVTAGSAAEKGT